MFRVEETTAEKEKRISNWSNFLVDEEKANNKMNPTVLHKKGNNAESNADKLETLPVQEERIEEKELNVELEKGNE